MRQSSLDVSLISELRLFFDGIKFGVFLIERISTALFSSRQQRIAKLHDVGLGGGGGWSLTAYKNVNT